MFFLPATKNHANLCWSKIRCERNYFPDAVLPAAHQESAGPSGPATMGINKVHPFTISCTTPVASQSTATMVVSLSGREQGAAIGIRRACAAGGDASLQQARQAGIAQAKDRFINLCRRRKIRVKETFFKLLAQCPTDDKEQLLDKACCYFANVDTSKNLSTQSLTSMIYRGESSASTKIGITGFLKVTDADIQTVVRAGGLRSVASMYNGRGFPRAEDVVALLSLPILQKGGRLDEQLLTTVSSMCNKRCCPDSGELEGLLSLPSLQLAGQPRLSLLRSIAHICYGRGIPPLQSVDNLLQLPCLREGDLPDPKRLRALSSMCRSRGIPPCEDVISLFQLMQRHGVPGKLMELLQCFSSLYRDRGLPAPEEQLTLLQLPALQRAGRLDQDLLQVVAAENLGMGFPTNAAVFQAWIHLLQRESLRSGNEKKILPTTHASGERMMASSQPSATAVTSGQYQFVVQGLPDAGMPSNGNTQNVSNNAGLPDAGMPSLHSPIAGRFGSASSNDEELKTEQEPARRINEIIHDLLDVSPSASLIPTPAQPTQMPLSSAESEVLDWLEEIIEADSSSSSQRGYGQEY